MSTSQPPGKRPIPGNNDGRQPAGASGQSQDGLDIDDRDASDIDDDDDPDLDPSDSADVKGFAAYAHTPVRNTDEELDDDPRIRDVNPDDIGDPDVEALDDGEDLDVSPLGDSRSDGNADESHERR